MEPATPRPSWAEGPEGPWAAALAVLAVLVVLGWPLASVTYPPMTDLPMHAAQTSALRHFFDPAWHFQDQFELHPIAAPYLSTYALGALLMLALPASIAVRVATGIALAMVPAGLGVLAWGMRKSPLLGLAAAPLVWCHLTHWGFVSFVSAIGLDAMVVGLSLRLVDRPSRSVRVALGFAFVVLFFTHIFRFPYAVLGALSAAVLAAWAKAPPAALAGRVREVLRRASVIGLPMVPSLALFVWFWIVRPRALTPGAGDLPLQIELARLREVVTYLVGGFRDPDEMSSARVALGVVVGVAVAAWGARLLRRDATPVADGADRRFRRLATATVVVQVAGFAFGYLTLPIQIGSWWYIYPREATAVVVFALALLPDLPRLPGARLLAVAALAFGAFTFARVTHTHFAAFEQRTADFRRIIRRIPQAPKLLYLVYDHAGSARTVTPWIHLPAWVQAERGGWLSFHFAVFGASPFRYRTDGDAIVPPPVPERWEWEPWQFDVTTNGRGFEWFLVRAEEPEAPSGLFVADPAIHLASHEGTWWLYRRGEP